MQPNNIKIGNILIRSPYWQSFTCFIEDSRLKEIEKRKIGYIVNIDRKGMKEEYPKIKVKWITSQGQIIDFIHGNELEIYRVQQ